MKLKSFSATQAGVRRYMLRSSTLSDALRAARSVVASVDLLLKGMNCTVLLVAGSKKALLEKRPCARLVRVTHSEAATLRLKLVKGQYPGRSCGAGSDGITLSRKPVGGLRMYARTRGWATTFFAAHTRRS